jgi:hypothetical protein
MVALTQLSWCGRNCGDAASVGVTKRDIPEDIAAFVQGSIPSVWTLELLLLMWRDAARSWRAEDLDKELRASPLTVANGLAGLSGAGIIVEEGSGLFRYGPARPELEDLVARLVALYRTRPFAVTQAILAAPSDKIRVFADAFRLKKN